MLLLPQTLVSLIEEGGMGGGGGKDHFSHKLNRAFRVSRAKKPHFYE